MSPTVLSTTMGALDKLSPRELEISRLVAQGLPNKAIANVLDLSPHTISVHLKNTYAKLDIASRTQLAVMIIGGLRADETLAPLPEVDARPLGRFSLKSA